MTVVSNIAWESECLMITLLASTKVKPEITLLMYHSIQHSGEESSVLSYIELHVFSSYIFLNHTISQSRLDEIS